jgi:hypothetical protein
VNSRHPVISKYFKYFIDARMTSNIDLVGALTVAGGPENNKK